MAGPFTPLNVTVTVGATLLLFRLLLRQRSTVSLPPGPKKLPIIGNLLDVPIEQQWLKFTEWGNQYGDLVSLSVFGEHYVIIGSAQKATEMLDKKNRIYSDRPVVPMSGELVGWKESAMLLPYGQRLRNQRKMFHQVIGTCEAMSRFHYIGESEVHHFLKRLLINPDGLEENIGRTAGSIILRITYGYDVKEGKDPLLSAANQALEQFSLSAYPGAFLVNIIPALRYLPEWFPGAGFKETAKAWKKTLHEMVEGPYRFVKKQMESGIAKPSMLSDLLQDESKVSDDTIHDIKWASASLYAGGADSTVASVYGFFKAMVLYPDVQARAQAEIDAIIGNDRLPTVADREDLPYVSALAMEVLRWHVVAPAGGPHRVMEDDIHDGYFIPKGAMVLANVWKMTRDNNVYKSPSTFSPARFIRTENHEPEPDPRNIIFGFGRR
ncbi:hypothetical protein AX15_005855 [Amanita polypyramis BW_CC]|nr:hypothetical protein AX15_005855 [Amanita polypyramis BW_CC]